jgi:hypothetical protein
MTRTDDRPGPRPARLRPRLAGTGRLADDLYLIAHHETTGRPLLQPRAVSLGLAGALLAELIPAGAIEIVAGGVAVVDPGPPEDGLAREVLGQVHGERAQHLTQTWLAFLARTAPADVADRLEQSGYLTRAPARWPWSGQRWIPADAECAFTPVARVKSALDPSRQVTAQGAALAGLAAACGLGARLALYLPPGFRRQAAAGSRPGGVSRALARDRLGVPAVLSFVLASVAPLTVAAGVIPTAYQTTGLTGIPAAFLAIAVILALFAAGYVAMTRHITNSGAFYAFISRGIGRVVGVSAALVALLSYSFLQVALYGALGPAAESEAAAHLGVHEAWWRWALAAWAVVTVLGLLRVDITGRILGVLLSAEILVILAETILGLAHPAGGHVSFATLSQAALTSAGFGTFGVLAVVAGLGFVGFEQAPVLAEEARNTRRTIPVATYAALGMIAVVYAGASWGMAVRNGTGHVVAAAGAQGPACCSAWAAAADCRRPPSCCSSPRCSPPPWRSTMWSGATCTPSAVRACCPRHWGAPAATTSPRPRRWSRARPRWPPSCSAASSCSPCSTMRPCSASRPAIPPPGCCPPVTPQWPRSGRPGGWP